MKIRPVIPQGIPLGAVPGIPPSVILEDISPGILQKISPGVS